MKTKLSYIVLALLAMYLTNCKKEMTVKPSSDDRANESAASSLAASGVVRNSVFTIAGSPYTTGPTLVNGNGKDARFFKPVGIQLMDDGTIFVADSRNNVIRKVTSSGIVSTFDFVKPGDVPLSDPQYIGISKKGIINIIDVGDIGFSEGRIYKPDGTLVVSVNYYYARYTALAKDPYEDVFWFNNATSIQKFLPNTYGDIGKDALQFNTEFIDFSEAHPTFTALFMGYNKVAYFSYNGQLFKHTQSNVGARIFPDLYLPTVTCIVANKDSRTIYVACGGYIKRIDDGRVTTIAGPDNTNADGHDGVGLKADVYAEYLALSKDESTLYFSDSRNNTIRKIVMR